MFEGGEGGWDGMGWDEAPFVIWNRLNGFDKVRLDIIRDRVPAAKRCTDAHQDSFDLVSSPNSGVSPKQTFARIPGYRSPLVTHPSTAVLISWTSSLLKFTCNAPRFSSRYLTFFVPGIGTTSSPCAINHANVNCPTVQPFRPAIVPNFPTSSRFFGKFSFENRGMRLRPSSGSKSSALLYRPVSMPRPSGL